MTKSNSKFTEIITHFKKSDPKLYAVLEKVLDVNGDEFFNLTKHQFLFDRLLESIVSQQLSVRSSDAIYQRLINLMPNKKLTPENLLNAKETDLRKAGLSYQKIKYIRDLSEKVKTGELDLDSLEKRDNESVIKELVKVKGIGKWTAEMFLMSALGRPDIFSHGDLGLQNAIKKIYQESLPFDKKGKWKYDPVIAEEIVIKWAPYRTIAARILWKSLSLKD